MLPIGLIPTKVPINIQGFLGYITWYLFRRLFRDPFAENGLVRPNKRVQGTT